MAMTLITTNTSSVAASSSFTSSIDSTYKLYIFKFYDVNPATDGTFFGFQGNATDTTSYGVTMTTTHFWAQHSEADSPGGLEYVASEDQAQGTSFQPLTGNIGSDADQAATGTLWLFNPSNTTYVKHFYSTVSCATSDDYEGNAFVGGYFNDTTAIDDIQFKMSSGNMDAVISMYGVG